MTEKDDFMKIRRIENGLVIDHLPPGKALKILEILGVGEEFGGEVSVAMNVPSSHYGRKDVVKLEGRNMDPRQINRIALVAPEATVNVVKNYEVVDKHVVQVPQVLESVVACPNANCITTIEGRPKLLLDQKTPLLLRCAYCEKVYAENELKY